LEEEKWSRGAAFPERQKRVCGESKEEWGSAMGLGMDRHAELDQPHLDYHVNELWEASKASSARVVAWSYCFVGGAVDDFHPSVRVRDVCSKCEIHFIPPPISSHSGHPQDCGEKSKAS